MSCGGWGGTQTWSLAFCSSPVSEQQVQEPPLSELPASGRRAGCCVTRPRSPTNRQRNPGPPLGWVPPHAGGAEAAHVLRARPAAQTAAWARNPVSAALGSGAVWPTMGWGCEHIAAWASWAVEDGGFSLINPFAHTGLEPGRGGASGPRTQPGGPRGPQGPWLLGRRGGRGCSTLPSGQACARAWFRPGNTGIALPQSQTGACQERSLTLLGPPEGLASRCGWLVFK